MQYIILHQHRQETFARRLYFCRVIYSRHRYLCLFRMLQYAVFWLNVSSMRTYNLQQNRILLFKRRRTEFSVRHEGYMIAILRKPPTIFLNIAFRQNQNLISDDSR